jgi:hypothetical protein
MTTAIMDVLTKRHAKAARGQRFHQSFVWKLLRDANVQRAA